jgi:hypothetical protein
LYGFGSEFIGIEFKGASSSILSYVVLAPVFQILPYHYTWSLHHGEETTSGNVNALHFITIFCLISGIYKLSLEKTFTYGRKKNLVMFSCTFLLE